MSSRRHLGLVTATTSSSYAVWPDKRTCSIHGSHEQGVQTLPGQVRDSIYRGYTIVRAK